MRKYLRQLKHAFWVLNGYVGLRHALDIPQQVTLLITYYNPVRMRHINHLLRNVLKCQFVERIIISNHNPEIQIGTLINVKDHRITVINQEIRRGCGHRWLVAKEFSPDYLIVIDDDILLFPWQLKELFKSLVAEPQIPHGLVGMVRHEDGFLEYREKENRTVDYICEIYAITGDHLNQYVDTREKVVHNHELAKMIDFMADFMLISKSGRNHPKIHNAGRLVRCPSFNEVGVAVHKEKGFDETMLQVEKAMQEH